MSIELLPETEKAIRERAAAEGMTVEALLSRTFAESPEERVNRKLREWQAETGFGSEGARENAPLRELFQKWAEEDALLTDEEREAQDRLWVDIEASLTDRSRRFNINRDES